MVALNDPGTFEALNDCGLLKYFKLSEMRQQLELLQFLVHSWDLAEQIFHIGDKVLPILIDDIYFLTDCWDMVPPFLFQVLPVGVN